MTKSKKANFSGPKYSAYARINFLYQVKIIYLFIMLYIHYNSQTKLIIDIYII